MIIGDCPYEGCKGDVWTPLQEGIPIQRQVCEECKRVFWTLHSRLDPKSWTDEEFKKIADVNEETRKITFKDKTKWRER